MGEWHVWTDDFGSGEAETVYIKNGLPIIVFYYLSLFSFFSPSSDSFKDLLVFDKDLGCSLFFGVYNQHGSGVGSLSTL